MCACVLGQFFQVVSLLLMCNVARISACLVVSSYWCVQESIDMNVYMFIILWFPEMTDSSDIQTYHTHKRIHARNTCWCIKR